MSIPAGYTTDKFTINASYNILENGFDAGALQVDTNGDSLHEIALDLMRFFEGGADSAGEFTPWDATDTGDYARLEIRGEVFKDDGEGSYLNEVNTVQIIIEAIEK